MGISETDLGFLFGHGIRTARVCDIGDQDLAIHDDVAYADMCSRMQRTFARSGKAADFWKGVGAEYVALDIMGDVRRFDLNNGSVPFYWRRFDLVMNCGTTEHVFNQANAFRVIHDLTKAGGVMYHQVPISGYAAHGLFSYNIKLFRLLAEANGYELIASHASACKTQDGPPGPDVPHNLERWRATFSADDASLRIAFRKKTNRGFRFPLDLPD